MQSTGYTAHTAPPARAPGSFSPIAPHTASTTATSQRPPLRRVETSSSEDLSLLVSKSRPQSSQNAHAPPRPFYAHSKGNSSSTSLQNFSRPTGSLIRSETPLRNASPLNLALATKSSVGDFQKGHGRKHSQSQGSFSPILPTAASSNLSNMATGLSASQIAAQAAMQHQSNHTRQRSQTVPNQQTDNIANTAGNRKPSRGGPTSPPLLSLTEASGPREPSFGGQLYHNGLLGGHISAAQTAANLVFPKSPGSSPALPPAEYEHRMQPDKPIKTEKSKVKLFSRPGKIGIGKDKDPRAGTLPSPSKLGPIDQISREETS